MDSPPKINPLQKQLEEKRFRHGVKYVEQAAGGPKKLTSSELGHLNQILNDREEEDPWRFQTTTIGIPGGTVEVKMHSNPLNRAREITGNALQMAGNGKVVEAACYLYSDLVLEHLFQDGNRRTAVLATVWLLGTAGIQVDAEKLLNIPIGNLRNQVELTIFQSRVEQLIYGRT
ncbi:MAG: Fic family protein [Pseudobdellovibrionaceae bacterium]